MTPRAAPLDLASASLIQDGTRFKLVITTRGSYEPAKLKTRGRRVLCLDVSYGRPRETVGLCVGTLCGRLVLRRRLDRLVVRVFGAYLRHAVGHEQVRGVLARCPSHQVREHERAVACEELTVGLCLRPGRRGTDGLGRLADGRLS